MSIYEQELQNLIYSLENDGSSPYSKYFIIDPKTRKITAPKDFVTLGVESDADSERIWFECPRYVGDTVDLTTRNIYINYENANGEKDSWYSDDVVADGDNIHFSWKIEKKVVRYKGNVKFIVCAMSTDTEGKVLADWNTTLCTASVLEGLEVENPEPPEEEYNLINQLIDVTKNAISEVNSISASSKEEIDELRLQSLADVEAEKTKSIEEVNATKQEALDYIGTGVDKSLSKENLAADAKATGDAILKYAIKPTSQGSLHALSDSAEQPLQGMKIFGKTKQATTTGKNLLPYVPQSKTTLYNGITFVENGDGTITVNGTATANAAYSFISASRAFALTTGTQYTLRGCPSGGSMDTYRLSIQTTDYLANYDDVGNGNTFTAPDKACYAFVMIKAGVTVNNLTFHPIIVEGSTYDGVWEPYTGGMPSPNPDYPQELKSVGDDGSVELFVKGKNLFNYASHVANQHYSEIPVVGGKTIYRNGNIGSGALWVIYDVSGNVLGDFGTFGFTASNPLVLPNDAAYIKSTDPGYDLMKTLYIGYIRDNTYEPYKSQSLTIPTPNGLPGVPVSSGGNYTDENGQQWISDEIDLERGVYVQRVGKLVLDGTESISANSATNTSQFYITNISQRGLVGSRQINSHYVNAGFGYGYDSLPDGCGIRGGNFWLLDRAFSSANDVKSFLTVQYNAGTPLTHLYPLETPIETPLSEEEIAAYKALHTNYPNTTIYNDDGAYTEVKYVADTKNYVDNKIANEVVKLTATITT